MSSEWAHSVRGARFFDGTAPEIAKQLGEIAKVLPGLVTAFTEMQKPSTATGRCAYCDELIRRWGVERTIFVDRNRELQEALTNAGVDPVQVPHGVSPSASPEGSHWENDPRFGPEDWKYEVANGDTRLGYAEWVLHQKEADPNADTFACAKCKDVRDIEDSVEQENGDLFCWGCAVQLRCAICGKLTDKKTAHLHQDSWVGECCWDERLKASE